MSRAKQTGRDSSKWKLIVRGSTTADASVCWLAGGRVRNAGVRAHRSQEVMGRSAAESEHTSYVLFNERAACKLLPKAQHISNREH